MRRRVLLWTNTSGGTGGMSSLRVVIVPGVDFGRSVVLARSRLVTSAPGWTKGGMGGRALCPSDARRARPVLASLRWNQLIMGLLDRRETFFCVPGWDWVGRATSFVRSCRCWLESEVERVALGGAVPLD
jgi:hypothetical protein